MIKTNFWELVTILNLKTKYRQQKQKKEIKFIK